MLFLLENGYKLNQINGNSGVYVASRAGKHAVFATNAFDELNKVTQGWHSTEAAATAEAEEVVRELAFF